MILCLYLNITVLDGTGYDVISYLGAFMASVIIITESIELITKILKSKKVKIEHSKDVSRDELDETMQELKRTIEEEL